MMIHPGHCLVMMAVGCCLVMMVVGCCLVMVALDLCLVMGCCLALAHRCKPLVPCNTEPAYLCMGVLNSQESIHLYI
jgi:hypothetical protein